MALELGIKLFASVRDEIGQDSLAIELEEGACVGELLDVLSQRYPEIARRRSGLAVAVNLELASKERVLLPEDEVALIPPVGGG